MPTAERGAKDLEADSKAEEQSQLEINGENDERTMSKDGPIVSSLTGRSATSLAITSSVMLRGVLRSRESA